MHPFFVHNALSVHLNLAQGTLLIGPTLHVWYNLLSRVPFTGNTGALCNTKCTTHTLLC